MKREELRNILRNEFSVDTNRFQIIKEVEIFVVTEQSVGQEFVLRLLARIKDFQGMESMIHSLVRQVGLFPYLEEENLSLKDTIAYEVHRPSGFKENIPTLDSLPDKTCFTFSIICSALSPEELPSSEGLYVPFIIS
mgnify:CR=1 FL=1